MRSISVIYKISILLLIITLIPFGIMSFAILSGLPVLKERIDNASQLLQNESSARLKKVGEIAINNRKDTLDAQSEKMIRIRLLEVSKQISDFLRGVEEDTLLPAKLPQDEKTYLFFSAKKRSVWFNGDDYDMVPVYSEPSFIGTDGIERVKIRNGFIRKDYLDLNLDRNLEFKAKTLPDSPLINYFKEGMKLREGEIYDR